MMKKFAVLGTTLCMGMLLASCGSSKDRGRKRIPSGINANPKRKENRRNDVCPGDNPI